MGSFELFVCLVFADVLYSPLQRRQSNWAVGTKVLSCCCFCSLFFAPNSASDLHDRASDGGRATLLLLDRADDPLSPLMHEFTYQCLVEDLLGIKVMIMRGLSLRRC